MNILNELNEYDSLIYDMIFDIEERFLCDSNDLGDSNCESDLEVDYNRIVCNK